MEQCTQEVLPSGNIHSHFSSYEKRISHARRGFAQLAALVSVVMAVIISGAGLYFYQQKTATQALLIPTLDLEGASLPQTDLSARLIGNVGGIDVHFFSASEAAAGFTAPADVHILFHCPSSTTGLSFEVAHGDSHAQGEVRAWGYEYSGRENENEAAGRRGRDLFDGRFWLSRAELAVTGDRFGHLHTENMQLQADRRYYMMTSADLRVSCVDSDGDGLNDGREDQNGNGVVDSGETDPHDADSDDDGVSDGEEVEGGTDPSDPSSVIECGDGVDNDEDDLIDDKDPGCHDADSNTSNPASYDPSDLSETGDRICGNGEVEGSERCDDGKQCDGMGGSWVDCTSDTSECADPVTCKRRGGDGCSASCQVEGYECDDGRDNDGNADIDQKDPDCHEDENIENILSWKPDRKESNNLCGNGEVDAGEECDDGRACANGVSCVPGDMGCEDSSVCIQRNNDGCSITCMSESGGGGGGGSVCGNGTVEGSEECDDGNTVNNDGCSSTCMSESGGGGGGSSVCGNGMVEGTEQCDDGNTTDGDGCNSMCATTTQCNDKVENDGDERIDSNDPGCHSDGNASHDATYVSADDDESHTAGWGNGAVEGDEECDDGNSEIDDGCSGSYTVEDGWMCSGSPSTCEVHIPELPGE